jgi:hypothetical protein
MSAELVLAGQSTVLPSAWARMTTLCADRWSVCLRLCVSLDVAARALCTRAQTPSVGLIIIGVITFISSMIGCYGVHILKVV